MRSVPLETIFGVMGLCGTNTVVKKSRALDATWRARAGRGSGSPGASGHQEGPQLGDVEGRARDQAGAERDGQDAAARGILVQQHDERAAAWRLTQALPYARDRVRVQIEEIDDDGVSRVDRGCLFIEVEKRDRRTCGKVLRKPALRAASSVRTRIPPIGAPDAETPPQSNSASTASCETAAVRAARAIEEAVLIGVPGLLGSR